jgi:hypothetical protein
LELIEKSVFPPPGSVIVTVCVITLRLQKFPRATTSLTLVFTRCCWFSRPTGKTVTPLSLTACSTSLLAVSTARPVRFSVSA